MLALDFSRVVVWLTLIGALPADPVHREPPPALAPAIAVGRAAVLTDNAGALSEILVYYATYGNPGIRAVISDLLEALPVDVTLAVACATRKDLEDFDYHFGGRIRQSRRPLRIVNLDIDISIWARDRVIARQFPRGAPAPALVPKPAASFDAWRLHEHYTPFALEAAGILKDVTTAALVLEGGNVVGTPEGVFVGHNVLADNLSLIQDLGADVVTDRLETLLGRPVMLVGSPFGGVPWNHVDMYLTPLQDGMMMVGDPLLAEQLLTAAGVTDDREPLPNRRQRRFSTNVEPFDAIAEQMALAGFSVTRLPVILHPTDDWMVTYNNVLMDERDGHLTVYMPVYGFPELDDYAAETYMSLGLTVRTIDVSQIFMNGGALRCVANVVRRRTVPAAAPR